MIFELIIFLIAITILVVGLVLYFTNKKKSVVKEKVFTVTHIVDENVDGPESFLTINNQNDTDLPEYTIDWGDGTIEKLTIGFPIHLYKEFGTYTVTVKYSFDIFNLTLSGEGVTAAGGGAGSGTGNLQLTKLIVDESNLELLLVGSPYLEELIFVTKLNGLKDLDVSNNNYPFEYLLTDNLTYLNISNRGYINTDILNILPKNINSLIIGRNQIENFNNLDLLPNLTVLIIDNNLVTDLIVPKRITGLNCGYNPLNNLSFESDSDINSLSINSTQITSFNATALTKLGEFECNYSYYITSLDFSGLQNLTNIYCNFNPNLTSVNLTNCVILDSCNLINNSLLSTLNITTLTSLSNLNLNNCGFSTPTTQLIGLNSCINIRGLKLSDNSINQSEAEAVAQILYDNTTRLEGTLAILNQESNTLSISGPLLSLQNRGWFII